MTGIPMWLAIRDPAIGRLWAAMALAALADQSFTVVLSWVAVSALGTAAGYLAVLQGAVGLAVALLAGHVADGFAPLAVMRAALLARAAALGMVIAAWLAAGTPPGWVLAMAVAVLAAGMALYRPAVQTALPDLARAAERLPAANALLDTTERIARLLGPGLLGLAAGLLPMAGFLALQATGFAAAGLLLGRLAQRFTQPSARGGREPMVAAVARGFRAVRRHRLLWVLMLMTAPMNGAWYAAVFLGTPLLIEASRQPGVDGSGLAAFGLVIATYGGANLLATLVVGNRRMPARPAGLIFAGYLLLGLGIVVMGLGALLLPANRLLAWLLAGALLSGIGAPMMDVATATVRQTALARADLAASVRAFMVVNNLGLLGMLAIAPALFDALGVAEAVVLCGGLITLQGAGGLLARRRVTN